MDTTQSFAHDYPSELMFPTLVGLDCGAEVGSQLNPSLVTALGCRDLLMPGQALSHR